MTQFYFNIDMEITGVIFIRKKSEIVDLCNNAQCQSLLFKFCHYLQVEDGGRNVRGVRQLINVIIPTQKLKLMNALTPR